MVPELNSPLVCSLSGGFSEKGDVQSRGIN